MIGPAVIDRLKVSQAGKWIRQPAIAVRGTGAGVVVDEPNDPAYRDGHGRSAITGCAGRAGVIGQPVSESVVAGP